MRRVCLCFFVGATLGVGFSQTIKVTEIAIQGGQPPRRVETAPDGRLWAVATTNNPQTVTGLGQGSFPGAPSLRVVGNLPLSFNPFISTKSIGGGITNITPFSPQNGTTFTFAPGQSDLRIINGVTLGGITTPEFSIDVDKGTIQQVCKSYTLDGAKLPDRIIVSGSSFGTEKQYLVSNMVPSTIDPFNLTNGPSTIYIRNSVDAAGACDLKTKQATTMPLLQAWPRAAGEYVFEKLDKVNPVDLTTTSVGILKDGIAKMWVSSDPNANPQEKSAGTVGNNTTLLFDPSNLLSLVTYLTNGGGHGIVVDKDDKITQVYANEEGFCSQRIIATSFRYPWVVLNCGSESNFVSDKLIVKNIVTGLKYTSDDLIPYIPDGFHIVISGGCITPQGTLIMMASSGNQSKQFAVDLVGVTGFPKPTFTMSADNTTVSSGNPVKLTWASTNATAVNIGIGGLGDLPISGSLVVNITDTQTITGFAIGPGGFSDTVTVIVNVKAVTPVPMFAANAVVSAASFKPSCSSGSLCTIFGKNLAMGMASANTLPLLANLAGTQVLINGVAAPLVYVSSDQINFQVPVETTGNTANFQVVTQQGTSAVVMVPLSNTPGFFTGESRNIIATDPAGNIIGTLGDPAVGEDVIVAYTTGLGSTNCQIKTGEATPPILCQTLETPDITIGNQKAQILFSGLTPGFVGLYQINLVVPGKRPVDMNKTTTSPSVITINEQRSGDSAFIQIAQ